MNPTLIPVLCSVVAAAAAIVSALISAHFQRKTARENADLARKTAEVQKLKDEIAGLKKDLNRAYRQVAAYYELEGIAAEELGIAGAKAARTIKSELRDAVQQLGLDRPEWTRKECESRLMELNG